MSMIGAINKVYGKTWTLNGATYVDGVFTFPANGFAMATCSMPNPIAGHLYYGSVEQKAPSGASFDDRRFEWWVGDEAGNVMAFAYMDGTNDQWVRQSAVLKVDAVVKDGWVMRNFTVNGTAEAYRRNPIIIDLTEAFGAGNEPTAAWVDANMIPSANGDTIFFDVPSAENAVEDRRRMMLAASGGGPLVIYEQGDNKFQNCTVYERSGYENKTFVFYSSYVLIGKSGSVYYLDLGVDFTKYNTLHIVLSTPTYHDGNIGYSQRAHPSPNLYTAGADLDYGQTKKEFTFDISARTGTWRIHFRGDQIYVYDIWLD